MSIRAVWHLRHIEAALISNKEKGKSVSVIKKVVSFEVMSTQLVDGKNEDNCFISFL